MRCVLLAVALLAGCSDVHVLEVDYVFSDSVLADGRRFLLRSPEDGCALRSCFPVTETIVLRNIGNCLMSDVWNLIDVR